MATVTAAAGILVAAAVAAAGTGTRTDRAVRYLRGHQQPDGGFSEAGGTVDAALTSWVALALTAARRPADGAAAYLEAAPAGGTAADLALRIVALRAAGSDATEPLARLDGLRRADGRIGPLVSSTAWAVLALRAAGRPVGAATIRYLVRRQSRSGGWSWAPRGAPDSNDTAAVVQALRAAGVPARSRAIRRATRYLRRRQNRDGGFELVPGRASDTQSTAWAIQALLAAGARPGAHAYAFLRGMQRADGSFRYSARYVTTPVWVTAQAVPALARKPFPIG